MPKKKDNHLEGWTAVLVRLPPEMVDVLDAASDDGAGTRTSLIREAVAALFEVQAVRRGNANQVAFDQQELPI